MIICNQLRYLYRHAVKGLQVLPQQHLAGMDVFCGGHVVVRDGYAFYDYWEALVGRFQNNGVALRQQFGHERYSSHYDGGRTNPAKPGGTVPQYEIHFPDGYGCFLFGKYMTRNGNARALDGNRPYTWFQVEGAPVCDFWGHVGTTFQYARSGMMKNVGALGKSTYTDSNPVFVPANRVLDPYHARFAG